MTALLSKIPGKSRRGRHIAAVLCMACAMLLVAALPTNLYGTAQQSTQSAAPAKPQGPTSSESAYQKYLRERQYVEKYRRKLERKEEARESRTDNPEGHDDADQYRYAPIVQSMAHRLGMSTYTAAIVFEWLNFFVLLAAIGWFVARVLPKTLRGRRERIQGEIEEARAATEDANRRLMGVEQRLSKLGEEIEAMYAQAQRDMVAEERRLRAALEEEKDRIVHEAAKEVNAASATAQRQLKNLTADLVIEHARRQVVVNVPTDRALVDAFLAGLPGERHGGGVN
jgi:F-type H+-transporting ATPase subunit b